MLLLLLVVSEMHLPMETHVLQFLAPKSSQLALPIHTSPRRIPILQSQISIPQGGRSLRLNSTNSSDDPPKPAITAPDAVEIRFRRRSKKRRRQREDNDGSGQTIKAKAPSTPKKWEDMNLSEKAIELYMGEKGLLFWLNKFAYASIFIVIGGWILFRFVGPSLNLYQLDTPPLAPSSMFKG